MVCTFRILHYFCSDRDNTETILMEKTACERIDSASKELNSISQDLWSNPELAFEEYHAHDLLTAFLEKEGFEVLIG